jgi:hypothetical protein
MTGLPAAMALSRSASSTMLLVASPTERKVSADMVTSTESGSGIELDCIAPASVERVSVDVLPAAS